MTAEQIAAGLTRAERSASWIASGRRRVPNAVWTLHEKGLVDVSPAMGGWGWMPTAEGKQVRRILQETPDD